MFSAGFDGVSIATENYAKWLQHKGHQVSVVTAGSLFQKDYEKYKILRYPSIVIPQRQPYRFGLPEINPIFTAKVLSSQFDIVHAHCPFASGYLALEVAKLQHIPLIATFHSKYRDDFERIIPNKLVVDILIKQIVSFYEKADEVWVPQEKVKETLYEYGFKGEIRVAENGTDLNADTDINALRNRTRAEHNIDDKDLVFLFVGQHIWEKNTRLIIEALSLLNDINFKMFFVGTGYAANDMKQLVSDLHLNDKVKFVGQLNQREQLQSYYAMADLFLFPSLYDNAPLVVREAASMHTPALMMAGSTAAEVINDNQNGFLCTCNEAHAYAERLKNIVSNRTLLNEVSLKASDTLTRSWQNVIDEVEQRYLSCIEAKKQ